jgi:hypothetical protein
MSKFKNKLLLAGLIFFSFNTYSSGIWMPLPETIELAEIIFEGVVVDIYSKREPGIKSQMSQHKDGQVIKTVDLPTKLFTTFVFEIKDVLKGDYHDNVIEVKMHGGCDESKGICVSISTNYDYKINDKAVMFVSLNTNNNYYKRSNYSNAYVLKGSHGLLLTEGHITYLKEKNDNNEYVFKDVLTLEILKNKINELKDKNYKE